MSIGFKIKKLREEKNVTQPTLAYELKISQSELSKIENGKTRKIDFLLMNEICNYFQKDFEYFIMKVESADDWKLTDNLDNKVFSSEKIIFDIKKIIDENYQNKKLISSLLKENQLLKQKKGINES
ncbi:helix-turn-helix domain-containing protein [Flavobacterium saccharophilum]|uniref:Transcriptional regulator, contains XRE-family HTH domain n=1 Tax=Flavobacterium saccharophilum TaxID=29534 RepID=A0A1M7AMH4_9FLAO|nr:helix-turn-helix transcriptional regulator [Flavobacterium saccharophilum]SHL43950.1 Transcriptional regulator, contains XRE-family HTH domain [Flavobacterium saccharophilum]